MRLVLAREVGSSVFGVSCTVVSTSYQKELEVPDSRRSETGSKQPIVLAVGRKCRKPCSNSGNSK